MNHALPRGIGILGIGGRKQGVQVSIPTHDSRNLNAVFEGAVEDHVVIDSQATKIAARELGISSMGRAE